jgi:hypothetical protein
MTSACPLQSAAEILAQPTDRRHRRPRRQTPGNDRGPAAPFGDPCDRQTQRRVEHCEGQTAHQAKLPVGQSKLALDRLGDDIGDCPLDEVEGVDRQELP